MQRACATQEGSQLVQREVPEQPVGLWEGAWYPLWPDRYSFWQKLLAEVSTLADVNIVRYCVGTV